jgi:manganese/zinc/iron transport system permease protein
MAVRVVRNHRLWELYLIHFAEIAPSHVDRDADDIEHVLDSEMLAMLEARIGGQFPDTPPSPHEIEPAVALHHDSELGSESLR